MKDPITTPGKTYAVTSPNGCTVTTEDGLTLAEVEAGKQGYFVAVSGKVLLSDEAAVLTQVFKLAPQQWLAILGVLGGGIPAWFKALKTELTALLDGSKFELAWLSAENTLVVHTDRVSDELLAAVKATAEAAMPEGAVLVQYNHNMKISWRDINKYAKCKNVNAMLAVNPDYKNDLTSDNEWFYSLDSLGDGDYAFYKCNVSLFDSKLPKLRHASYMFYGCVLKSFNSELPELLNGTCMFQYVLRAFSWNIELPKLTNGDRMFGNTSITSWNVELPKLSNGSRMFDVCKLDKKSALLILNSIPAYTSGSHPLTIGIHIDHQHDEEVLEAIANAEAKGWTLTVQWNGKPTAQGAATYGLRKPPIYAKVGEIERPDGTTERVLDWGHYVTDPTGYEEFRSVEEAREYFGLPEEDLTETE